MASNVSAREPLLWMAGVILIDQLSKWWIMTSFFLYESRTVVPGFFNVTFVTNTGAAFGFLAGQENVFRQAFFVGIALLALAALALAYRHFRNEGRLAVTGLGLIAGGAVGNLIDRLRFGRVIDFLDVYIGPHHWPAFNVADSAITIGAGLLIFCSLKGRTK
ncbi:MAG: signal peptidase II [Desulfobacteraceae bacterium]|nr:signal peptidase II [Desulfobacteraceae bacterium]